VRDNKNPFAGRVAQNRATGSGAPLDVVVTEDQYLIEVDLPGVLLEDIELTIEDGELTIAAIRKRADEQTPKKAYAFNERRFGELTRTIALPGISGGAIAKKLADGVLTIAVGRREKSQDLS
jgi:HSP20 family protein